MPSAIDLAFFALFAIASLAGLVWLNMKRGYPRYPERRYPEDWRARRER